MFCIEDRIRPRVLDLYTDTKAIFSIIAEPLISIRSEQFLKTILTHSRLMWQNWIIAVYERSRILRSTDHSQLQIDQPDPYMPHKYNKSVQTMSVQTMSVQICQSKYVSPNDVSLSQTLQTILKSSSR